MNESSVQKGYFVILDEEEVKTLKKEMEVKGTRGGVYYEKEELVSILSSKPIQNKHMHIVEVAVPHDCITSPNCVKFGIKGGKAIPITKIEAFENVQNLELQA